MNKNSFLQFVGLIHTCTQNRTTWNGKDTKISEELLITLHSTTVYVLQIESQTMDVSKIKISASPISGGAMPSVQSQSAMREPNSTPECIYETLREIQVSKLYVMYALFLTHILVVSFVGASGPPYNHMFLWVSISRPYQIASLRNRNCCCHKCLTAAARITWVSKIGMPPTPNGALNQAGVLTECNAKPHSIGQ